MVEYSFADLYLYKHHIQKPCLYDSGVMRFSHVLSCLGFVHAVLLYIVISLYFGRAKILYNTYFRILLAIYIYIPRKHFLFFYLILMHVNALLVIDCWFCSFYELFL